MPILATLRANVAASLLGLLAAILLAISVYQAVQIHGFLWFDGLKDDLEECERDKNEIAGELLRISTEKNEQREETGRNIKEAETIRDKADGEARKIEQAPTAPNCATPPEILGADL